MGYIKKAHREILKILDDTPSFPNGWIILWINKLYIIT